MRKTTWLAAPALVGLTLVATRLVPGPVRGGATLLPSGWRIQPAGRQVSVGTLPLNLVVTGDGLAFVTNNGYGDNGLMRVDAAAGTAGWILRVRAAWLGLAHTGRRGADTLWASGGGRNRVYRLVSARLGATWTADSVVLADTSAELFVGGVAILPGQALDEEDRKSTRLNSSHITISYAVF